MASSNNEDEKLLNKHEKETLAISLSQPTKNRSSSILTSIRISLGSLKFQRILISTALCICERGFSKGKLILTDLRGSMDPCNFEDVLILSYYDDLWNVYLVNEVAEEERKGREIEKQSRQILPR